MGTLRLVGSDPLSPPELREEKAIPCEKLAFMLLSNDARYIAGLGVEGYKLWERDSARLLCSFPDTTSRAQAWAFTGWAFPPDGSVLAVSDVRGTVGFYQPRAGSLAKRLSGSEAGLFALTFSADGRLFGATTLDRRVRVWDLANDRLLISSAGPQVGLMRDVAFSPEGDKIAAVADNADVYVWEVSTGRLIRAFDNNLMANFGLTFTKDGKYLAVGGANSQISVFNITTGALERSFGREPNVVAALKLSPQGDLIAARYRNPVNTAKAAPIILWDTVSGKVRLKIEAPDTHFLAMSLGDNELVATSWSGGSLHVWTVPYRSH